MKISILKRLLLAVTLVGTAVIMGGCESDQDSPSRLCYEATGVIECPTKYVFAMEISLYPQSHATLTINDSGQTQSGSWTLQGFILHATNSMYDTQTKYYLGGGLGPYALLSTRSYWDDDNRAGWKEETKYIKRKPDQTEKTRRKAQSKKEKRENMVNQKRYSSYDINDINET